MMIGARFGDLPMFACFYSPYCHGCDLPLVKVSSRTARINGNGAVLWFSKQNPIVCDTSEVDYDAAP
jgi:hypothetical protein